MTLFSEPQETTPGVLTNPQAPAAEDFLAKVVETKGEQWKDPSVLAKGYLHASDYIKNLESQNAELKADVEKGANVQNLLNQLQSQSSNAPTGTAETPVVAPQASTGPTAETLAGMSEEELRKVVLETLSDQETSRTVQSNRKKAEDSFVSQYGDKAPEVLSAKAAELGMSLNDLGNLAEKSPTAFLNLVGAKPVVANNPTVGGTVSTESVTFQSNASTERNQAYYSKLRRENKRSYYDAATQQQMFQDKVRLGAAFNT